MNHLEPYFNQLYFSSSLEELYREIDRLVALGNFEATSAIRRYFLQTKIKEVKVYIVKKIPIIIDLKLKFRLLIEFSYINDLNIKEQIVESIKQINHPIFSHRLLSIYLNTKSENKKVNILKTFINTGISLFKEVLLAHFDQESTKVQQYILTYLVNTPFLSEESCEKIISLVSELLLREESQIEERKILHDLWLLSLNNPSIAKKAKKILQKSPNEYSLLHHLYETVRIEESKRLSNSKVIEMLYQAHTGIIHQIRFSKVLINSFIPSLENKLIEIEKDFHHTDHVFIWNLIRLNHIEIASLLVDMFKRSNHFNFKQIILDVLSFSSLNEELRNRLKPLCLELFNEKSHVRIFESLTRNIITILGHAGIKLIYEHYTNLESVEQRTQVLSGIIHVMMDFGFGKTLTALDNYNLNMILGDSIDYAFGNMNNNYVCKIFQIIKLLQTDSYIDEMFLLAQKSEINLEVLSSLLSLKSEKATNFVMREFEKWLKNPTQNKQKIQFTLDELGKKAFKKGGEITKEDLMFLLEQPSFTGQVISYCQKYEKKEFIEPIFKFYNIKSLTIQYSLVLLIGKYHSFIKTNVIYKMYQRADSFIKKKLSLFLIKSNQMELLREVYSFFIDESKDLKGLCEVLPEIPLEENIVKTHLQLVKELEEKITPTSFREIKMAMFEHFYFYAQNQVRTANEKKIFDTKVNSPTIDESSINTVNNQSFQKIKNVSLNFTKKFNQEIGFETVDINLLSDQYKKHIFLGYKELLLKRKEYLAKNTSFIKKIPEVFSKPIYYQEFIRKSGHFKVQLNAHKINFWMKIIAENIERLRDNIKSIDDLIHLYAMLLHENDFYSINNPLKMDLNYFYKNKIVDLMDELNAHHSKLGGHDKLEKLKYLNNFKEKSNHLLNFLKTLNARYSSI